MPSRVIAIDGPAGSGKSSTARAVAERLGLSHVDSGALYRAAALAALDAGLDLDGPKIVALVKALPVHLRLTEEGYRPEVAGVDVSSEIRSDRVTEQSSPVSALPEVREWVNGELRAAVRDHPRGAVLDGRDIGTVVFPDAALKIYLTANEAERARRRLRQLGRPTNEAAVKELQSRMAGRDKADSTRAVAPLSVAKDAVVLDTSELTFESQVQRVVDLAGTVFD